MLIWLERFVELEELAVLAELEELGQKKGDLSRLS